MEEPSASGPRAARAGKGGAMSERMPRWRLLLSLASGWACFAVSLAEPVVCLKITRDDAKVARLGLPRIAVLAEAQDSVQTGLLTAEVSAAIGSLGHARVVGAADDPDFVLRVRVTASEASDRGEHEEFAARLEDSRGDLAWAAEGWFLRDPTDPLRSLRTLARNLLDGLARGGWIRPRLDPADPPPPPPSVRRATESQP